MSDLTYAMQRTLGFEDGYANVKGDRGGETKYGITAALLHRYYPDMAVRDVTIAVATEIAIAEFWAPLRLEEVIDRKIAAEIFDTAYNMGPGNAALIAQAALDYLGEPIVLDGVIGPKTIAALNKWCAKDPVALFKCLNGFQFIAYVCLVDEGLVDRIKARFNGDAAQQKFAWGWTKRIQEYREV